jgi:hypothetical protein
MIIKDDHACQTPPALDLQNPLDFVLDFTIPARLKYQSGE